MMLLAAAFRAAPEFAALRVNPVVRHLDQVLMCYPGRSGIFGQGAPESVQVVTLRPVNRFPSEFVYQGPTESVQAHPARERFLNERIVLIHIRFDMIDERFGVAEEISLILT